MRLLTVATVFALAACSSRLEGPAPTVSGLINLSQPGSQPARLCNAQGGEGWQLELSGSGFAPLLQQVATGAPQVRLPTVAFEREGASVPLPPEFVTVVDSSKLALRVPVGAGGLTLEPGDYAVRVTSPLGASATLPNALRVVPPPALTTVSVPARGLVKWESSTLVLSGSGFRESEPPTVVLRRSGQPEIALTNVQVVSSIQVNVTLPAGTEEGDYEVEVRHIEGCSATAPQRLAVSYLRLGELTFEPRFGWEGRDQSITLYNEYTGNQRPFSSVPQIFLIAPLKGNMQTVRIPLRRVVRVSDSKVTAVVPTCSGNGAIPVTDPQCPGGIAPGGPYALEIRDRSGAVGELSASAGFYVLRQLPSITSLTPSAIPTDSASTLTVEGSNFGNNAKAQLIKLLDNGNLRVCELPEAELPSASRLRVRVLRTFGTDRCVDYMPTGRQQPAQGELTLSPGLYVVRVQTETAGVYAQYSGLIVTQPDFGPVNIPLQPSSPSLNAARADFPLVVATGEQGQPYLYALGGSNGSDTLSSIELAPITPHGDLGTFWSSNRMRLPSPLRGHAAVVRTAQDDTSYIFVLGGTQSDGSISRNILRAQVLKQSDAPVLLQPQPTSGGNLPAGTFYYRVSAVLSETDPNNPRGETLASEEDSVTVVGSGNNSANLQWSCVPNAVSYRIYRTINPNDSPGTQRLLEEIDAAGCASNLLKTSYVDQGRRQPVGDDDAPLPAGALGAWRNVGNLLQVRSQAAARVVGDDLYLVGGVVNSNNNLLNSVERATFTGNPPRLEIFSTVGNLQVARRRHSLAVADATTAPGSFTNTIPDNSRDVWLVVVGGLGSIGTGDFVEVARVRSSSGRVDSLSFAKDAYSVNSVTYGGWAEIISNRLFKAGSPGSTNFLLRSGILCNASGNVGKCESSDRFTGTVSDTGIGYQQGSPRYTAGAILFRGLIYVAGGFPSSSGGTPTATVERLVY